MKSLRFREKSWISRNWLRQGPKFRKLQEAIWLTVINEIFKSPPPPGSFCQINYLFELFLGYPSYPIQNWYIWASFQTSRKMFYKLRKAIWPTIINKIFKFPSRLCPYCEINYFLNSLWITRVTKFKSDTFGLVSRLLERNFVNSLNFHHSGNPFSKWAVSLTFVETARDIHFKNDTFRLVSSFFLHISH